MKAIIYLFFLFYLVAGIIRGARMIFWPGRFSKAQPAKANSESTEEPALAATMTPREKNRVRLRGALRLAICALLLSVLGLHFGWMKTEPRVLARGDGPTGSPSLIDEAAAKVESFFRDQKFVGLAVGIVTPNDEAIICLGRESLFGRDAVTENTLFEIGSITKTFTGTLLAKSIEEGQLELEQTVGSLLPAEAEVPPEIRSITLRQLTTHSAGFPMMPGNFQTPRRIAILLANRDPHASYTEEEFLRALKSLKLESRPGEKAEYSNFSSSLLGYLLAKKAGGSYEEVIREQILQPLEMNDTAIRLSPEQEERTATGYHKTYSLGPLRIARKSPAWTLPEAFAGAGALRSSLSDMMKYLKANMGRGTNALQSAMERAQTQLRDGMGEGTSVGMNWLIRQKDGAAQAIWHNGGTGGFRSFMGFTADHQVGVMVLNSTAQSVDALGGELLQFLQKSVRGGNAETNETPAKEKD